MRASLFWGEATIGFFGDDPDEPVIGIVGGLLGGYD
jgi:hypothetical protein